MFNANLLLEKIESSGLKRQTIADGLGITMQGLRNKLSGKTEFTASEAALLKAILRLTDYELIKIFFTRKVEKSDTCKKDNGSLNVSLNAPEEVLYED